METVIESNAEHWKQYNRRGRNYVIWRSCKYESTPGEPRSATEGNLPPRLTVKIFVHAVKAGQEVAIGSISIDIDRDRWNEIAHIGNAAEADNQLKQAANSVREGNSWQIDPLNRMLRKGCEVLPIKINEYEANGSQISGEFSI
jgi:hypothetical protein